MSFHVYISRDGFKDNPIPMDQWLTAVRQCGEVIVEDPTNQQRTNYRVTLKSNRHARFERTPYGLIHVQAPSREQIEVMFKLANLLDAGVYSEDLDRYVSVEDWEEKTRKFRHARDEHISAYRIKRRIKFGFIILFLFACALIGYIV